MFFGKLNLNLKFSTPSVLCDSQHSALDGDGDWTMFSSYKPLCEIDQMLVDTLQERKEMFCITDPAMYDNPIGHDTSPEDVAVIRNALREEKHARICLLNYRKDGTRFINQFNLSPLRDAEGKLAYFIGVQMAVEVFEGSSSQSAVAAAAAAGTSYPVYGSSRAVLGSLH
eukprot:7219-Heterococcus_DN1.PRE.1